MTHQQVREFLALADECCNKLTHLRNLARAYKLSVDGLEGAMRAVVHLDDEVAPLALDAIRAMPRWEQVA